MLPTLISKINLRVFLFFLFFWGIIFTGKAQVRDSTEQKPQLETQPPAAPTRPPVEQSQPAPTVPTPVPESVPEPAESEEPVSSKPSLRDKLFVGGSGDLGFSSNSYYGNFFNIGASPLLGYRITKRIALGPGLVYNYYSLSGNSFSDYGAKVFTQIIVYKAFFLHGEHQILNTQGFDASGRIQPDYRQSIQSTLAGAGYRQMASDRLGFDIYLLFNVANTNGVDNTRPIIRAGLIYNLK
ncbi:MAG: hypothetical protein JWQ14_555 [Adhaeribacter sp.]|nr:hypothetical protein [Adhaeribacter sp.]